MASVPRLAVVWTTALLASRFLPQATANPIEARGSNSAGLVAPLSVTPDGSWNGIDGAWSSFALRVGTPAQDVRVFISWASYQTWVVLPQGCPSASNPSSCEAARGGTFNPSASSTWDKIGFYNLGVEQDLGYNGDGLFGYDSVGLGSDTTYLPVIKNTTVAGYDFFDYYLGIFGVNPASSNLTSSDDSSPSYLSLLNDGNYIPSLSFGYTAGAIYQDSGILGSLTLGGYDASRIVENGVEFEMSADVRGGTAALLRSITTEPQNVSGSGPAELLPNPISITLDATVSQLWLPEVVCQAFATEFGLMYDKASDLYLVNDTQQTALFQRNPNITFQLSPSAGDNQTVSITLPFAAFDLTAQPPYQGLSVNTTYFPIRRALDHSHFTLGRTFFQEAYITVDFERQSFSLSAVDWNTASLQNLDLVTITPTSASASPSVSTSSNGISGGEIAGIVTGALAFVVIFGLAFTWLYRRRRHHLDSIAMATKNSPTETNSPMSEKEQLQNMSASPGNTANFTPPAMGSPPTTATSSTPSPPLKNTSRASSVTRSGALSPLRQVSYAHDNDLPTTPIRDMTAIENSPQAAAPRASSAVRSSSGRQSPALHAPGARVTDLNSDPYFANNPEGIVNSPIGVSDAPRTPPVETVLAVPEDQVFDDEDSAMAPPDIARHPRRSESSQRKLRKSLERRSSSTSTRGLTALPQLSADPESASRGRDGYPPRSGSTPPSATDAAQPARRLSHKRSVSHDDAGPNMRSRVHFAEMNGEFIGERPTSLWTAAQATPGSPIFTRSSNGRASPIWPDTRQRPQPLPVSQPQHRPSTTRRNSTGRTSLNGGETALRLDGNLAETSTIEASQRPRKPVSRPTSLDRASLRGYESGSALEPSPERSMVYQSRPEMMTSSSRRNSSSGNNYFAGEIDMATRVEMSSAQRISIPPKQPPMPGSRRNSSGRSSLIGIDSRESILLPTFDFEYHNGRS